MEFIAKEHCGLIRSTMYSEPVRGKMLKYNILEQELVQEGMIAIWQFPDMDENKSFTREKDPKNYLRACIINQCRKAMLSYVNIFYARRLEKPFSSILDYGDSEDSADVENNFLEKNIKNENVGEEFSKIEKDLKLFLRLVVHPKDKNKIDGWIRVLGLVASGFNSNEIRELTGIRNVDSIKSIRSTVLRYLQNSENKLFPRIDFKKIFAIKKIEGRGNSKRLFGAICIGKQKKLQEEKKQKRIEADFSQMSAKEICGKYNVSRSSAWRAKKQGFLIIGKASSIKLPEFLEEEDTRIKIDATFMPEQNRSFWSSIRLGVTDQEWVELWEWASGQRLECGIQTLEKVRKLAFEILSKERPCY